MSEIKVIAELAWGHDGKIEQAIDLLHAAKKAGADLCSIHITDLPSYMVRYYGKGEGKVSAGRESLDVYKYLEQINPSNDDWIKFYEESRKINMPLCIMPNDYPSLCFSEKRMNPAAYVVSAACFAEESFLKQVALSGRQTFFRIGGAYLGEIEKAIRIFFSNGNKDIVLLHGFQNYPTNLAEANISFLKTLKDLFSVEVGLADHIDGTDELAMVMPILSIAYGAKYIEKHITLDRSQKSEDFEAALEPPQFKKMVRFIKATPTAIGNPFLQEFSPATMKYRNVSRKRIVAGKSLSKGQKLTIEDIEFKRCDIGISPDQVNSVLGKALKENVSKDDAITLNLF